MTKEEARSEIKDLRRAVAICKEHHSQIPDIFPEVYAWYAHKPWQQSWSVKEYFRVRLNQLKQKFFFAEEV